MFKLVQLSVHNALSKLDWKLKHKGLQYKITYKVRAPVTLKITGLEDDVKFKIDLVPSLQFPLISLYHNKTLASQELFVQVRALYQKLEKNVKGASFQAIALHKVDREKFQLDFHDLERHILDDRPVARKVIKLMKFIRDRKGGPMTKICSYLLKVG